MEKFNCHFFLIFKTFDFVLSGLKIELEAEIIMIFFEII